MKVTNDHHKYLRRRIYRALRALDGRTGAIPLNLEQQSSFSTTAISAAFICIPPDRDQDSLPPKHH
jgi:hypothetical protein